MARAGQFKKGGGRVGGGGKSKSRKTKGKAIVVSPPRMIVVQPARRKSHAVKHHGMGMVRASHSSPARRRRGGGGHGGVTLGKIVLTGLVLGATCESATSPAGATIYNQVQKIPGAKTVGGASAAGLAIGALYKFTRFGGRFRPYMAAAGIVGVVLAAVKAGQQNTQFKWLGDADDQQWRGRRRGSDGIMDVET